MDKNNKNEDIRFKCYLGNDSQITVQMASITYMYHAAVYIYLRVSSRATTHYLSVPFTSVPFGCPLGLPGELLLRVVGEREVVHHEAGELPVVAVVALNDVVLECREGHATLGVLRRQKRMFNSPLRAQW